MITLETVAIAAADEDLRQRVHLFLLQTGRRWPATVSAADGTVTLHGVAPSFYERQLAVSATQRVAGVRKVIDHLVVAKSSAGLVADEQPAR